MQFETSWTRYRNSIKVVEAYPGVDIKSDHNTVVVSMNIKLQKDREKQEKGKVDLKILKMSKPKEKLELVSHNEDTI